MEVTGGSHLQSHHYALHETLYQLLFILHFIKPLHGILFIVPHHLLSLSSCLKFVILRVHIPKFHCLRISTY